MLLLQLLLTDISSRLSPAFFLRAFVCLTLFDYYRYIANPDLAHSSSSPDQVAIFIYDSGRIRISRRVQMLNIDSWYSSFEELTPILSVMLANARYIVDEFREHQPPYVMPRRVRARHAAYLSAVPADERRRRPYYSWLAEQPVEQECAPVSIR